MHLYVHVGPGFHFMDTKGSSHDVALNCSLMAHCVVSAGPGSGKTHFLVSRTARTYTEIPESFCYCVSFTNESSNEIKKRLSVQFPKHGPRIKCSTIHKFCLEGLNALNGGSNSLKIIRNDNALCEILNASIGSEQRAEVYRDIDKMSGDLCDEEVVDLDCSTDDDQVPTATTVRDLHYLKRILSISRQTSLPPLSSLLKSVLTTYRVKLTESHSVDFHTIVSTFLARLFTQSTLPFPLTHLFVDEFQDLDADQVSLVLLLVRQFGATLTVVGDPNQSIYAWRIKAQVDTFQRVKSAISVASFRLLENYRSDWKIVKACNCLIEDSLASIPTIRNPLSRVAAFAAASSKQELETLVSLIQEETKNENASIAVLFRYNIDKDRILKILREREIPFTTSVKQKVSVLPPKRSKGLLEVLWVLRTLTFANDTISAAQACLAGCGKALAETLKKTAFKKYACDPTCDPLNMSTLGNIGGLLISGEGPFQCEIAITSFRNRIAKLKAECILVRDVVAQLVKVPAADVRALLSLYGETAVKDVWSCLTAAKTNSTNLFIGTIHSGKGREWDTVIVPHVNEGVIPNDRAASIAEERRVLYVAMTRARSKLFLTCTHGSGCQPSRFLFDTQISISRLNCKRLRTDE